MSIVKINSESKIYVVCPAYNKTGGTELSHQFVFECNQQKINAIITYFNEDNQKEMINPAFKNYVTKYEIIENVEDDANNVLILPEIKADYTKKFQSIQKCIWWMSVDNFKKRNGINGSIKYYGFLRTIKFLLKKKINFFPYKLSNNVIHFYQSEYARQFLLKNNITNMYKLSDYINDSYLEKNINLKKENNVLYKQKKGLEFTKKIIKKSPQFNWIPIENMSNDEVAKLLRKSKVYIDFGNHPGKDRFPREAAISGCCVITGKRGAAKYHEDIPINDEFKFDDANKNIPKIINEINDCINNYSSNYEKFEEYRKIISNEHNVFKQDIKNIFKVNEL